MAANAREKWSWLYVWILLWMASLTLPLFVAWQAAVARSRGVDDWGTGYPVIPVLASATVVLGFAMGWQARRTSVWVAAALGALVMSIGVWVDYNHGWSGGEPQPEPVPFLVNFVILNILLWIGAGLGTAARTARDRRRPKTSGSAV